MSQSSEKSIKKQKTTNLQNVLVNKGGRPKFAVWEDFIVGDYDGKAHLALHYKGEVPENIRRHWLIEVARRSEKVKNDDSDIEKYIPPGRGTLSERILDEETARITVRIENLLDNAKNLTL
ncbi:19092_t:CDS:2, partial [Racocetra fulgida]